MKPHRFFHTLALAGLALGGAGAHAQSQAPAEGAAAGQPAMQPATQRAAQPAPAAPLFTWIDADPRSELWVDTGFATWHFDRDKDLNGANHGLGLEYRFSGTTSAVAGRFYNSDRAYSNYAGVIWQPWAIGPVRLGAAIAAFDGYPNMRRGGWFPAAIPTLTYDYQRVGVNVGIIPSYKDRLYGGISVQLKFRLF